MKRFFDFSPSLWQYFQEIDRRFSVGEEIVPVAAEVTCRSADLSSVRAVLWDVYGTLCGVELGDLVGSLEYEDRLLRAAEVTVEEFSLHGPLKRLKPDQPAEVTLSDLYQELIADSHLRSLATGVEYPEVVIEQIWLEILQDCIVQGLDVPDDEPPLHTAYRWAYFFDRALQRIYLYPGAAAALETLRQADIIQGIISNAQFYTPLHLRRLLRMEQGRDDIELEEFFSESLVLFSYELGFSKPNPRAFHLAIETLSRQGISPEEIVYLGNDMLNDISVAQRCGLRTILFAGDSTQTLLREDELHFRDIQPDAVVTELNQIAGMIVGMSG